MNILVSGSSGFIGSHLVSMLESKGFSVTRLSFNSKSNSINDYFQLKDLKGKHFDVLVHLGAIIENDDPQKLFSSNVVFTQKLLDFSVKNKIKQFILASSQTVYGLSRYLPVDENHPLRPITNYGLSKLMSEQISQMYSNYYDIDMTILRFSSVYGSGENKNFLIPKLFQNAYDGNLTINKYDNGFQLMDYIHVNDVCRSILQSCLLAKNGIFNIASGKSITPLMISKLVGKFFAEKKFFIREIDSETNHLIYDIRKAKKELKFTIKTKMDSDILYPYYSKLINELDK